MEERNGFPYHEELVELKLTTHLPTKWLTIDQETGDVWQGTETGTWKKAEPPPDLEQRILEQISGPRVGRNEG